MSTLTPDRFAAIIARRGIVLSSEESDRVFHGKIEGLLTTGNPKTAKGEKEGVLTAILHLAPSIGSGFQTCPKATEGCAAACLNTAGRGGMGLDSDGLNSVQRARRMRTYWYFARRDEFMARIVREIGNHVKTAYAHDLTPMVRLNGTSDIRWENVPVLVDGKVYDNIFAAFPHVTFYDYTKLTDRDVSGIPNYSLTFSLADGNLSDAIAARDNGVNVAAVFLDEDILDESTGLRSAQIRMRGMTFPDTFLGLPVIDGDKSDVRPHDPRGVIVGLRAKGSAILDTTGFVQRFRHAA